MGYEFSASLVNFRKRSQEKKFKKRIKMEKGIAYSRVCLRWEKESASNVENQWQSYERKVPFEASTFGNELLEDRIPTLIPAS